MPIDWFFLSLDQDECTEIPGICANGRCENTEGSFRCICQAGYTLNQGKSFCISKFSKKCGTCVGRYLSIIVILPSLQCLDICYILGAVQGFCYQRVVNNYCVDQSPTNTTKFDCCCSEKKPAGWGPLCERCPVQGTRELHVKHWHFHIIILCFSLPPAFPPIIMCANYCSFTAGYSTLCPNVTVPTVNPAGLLHDKGRQRLSLPRLKALFNAITK